MPYVKPLKPFESKFSHAIARRDTLGEPMWLNPSDYEELSEREGGPYFVDVEPKKADIRIDLAQKRDVSISRKYKKSKEAK